MVGGARARQISALHVSYTKTKAAELSSRDRRLSPLQAPSMTTVLSTEPSTLPELLKTRAYELGDAPFLRSVDVEWSYGEFARRVTEIASGLREIGVRRGDIVGVVLRNGPEYLEIWWAILWLGAVLNPVNPDLTGREVAQI